MSPDTLFRGTAIGLIAGLVVVLVLLFAREHKRTEQLEAAQRTVCLFRQGVIETILAGNSIGDVRAQIKLQLLDPTVSKMCTGQEVALDVLSADACWINTNDVTRCYREPLEQLLVLYKQHRD